MTRESVLCTLAASEAPAQANRRKSTRYRCSRARTVPLVAVPNRQSFEAVIRDFSLKSVGLVAKHAVEPGTTLILQLHSAATGLSVLLDAEVRHATEQPDGTWLLGC